MTTSRAGRVALLAVVLLLAMPEALLARHDLGPAGTAVTLGSDLAAVVAGVLLGTGAASVVLRSRPRSRRRTGFAVIVSLLLGSGVLVLANLLPPPFISTPYLRGLTVTGVLDAVYVVGLVGSAAAALRFTARYVRLLVQREPPTSGVA